MSDLSLRPRQAALIGKIATAFREGHKNIMVCAPCGFGKTEIATALLQRTYENGKRAAFVCDRIALIDQTSARFEKYGLSHGVIQAGHWRFRGYEQIQLCSIQTLARREWPETQLLVCDEAHVLSQTMRKKLERRDCFAIGLTATPVTRGLGKYFDTVINGATTNELIEEGWLVPYRIFAKTAPDMQGVKVVAGEWEEGETSKRALEVVGDVVAEYVKHGDGRKFIGFAVDVAHAQEIARQFMTAGIICRTYTYRESDDERRDMVAEFRKPDSSIRGLISIESLTRGFDVADVSVLILARPLRDSLAVHLQMMGRVLRPAEGKTEALILDHAGNCTRFWNRMTAVYEQGVTALDDGKKREKPKKGDEDGDAVMKCPQCAHLHMPRPACPNCGFEYPRRPAVKHVAGTLSELVASGNRRKLTEEVWPMVCAYARGHREGEAAKKMALGIYKTMTGTWPTRDFFDTEPAEVTREVYDRIRSSQIRYRHSAHRASH